MTYHILHITTSDCYLSVDKGFLFCKLKNGETNSISIGDIKAVIIAAFGISFSNNCISRLLENNVVILHCNNSFKPVGWSVPTERVVRTKVFYNQIAQNEKFENSLWKKILKAKVLNQYKCLKKMGIEADSIFKLINKPLLSEANIAKQYWSKYFPFFNKGIKREHKNAENFENGCLNYGYAVFSSLIYRSVIVHGLISGLGIHHKEKYKSTPLVYDLMEPYRAFADYYLYTFKGDDYKAWFKYFADCLKNYRIKINGISYKIIDSVDIYVEKIADAYLKFDDGKIFLPDIDEQYLHIDKHRNREFEE